MKSTGIVRPLDSLGRIVLPKEVRRTYELNADTPIEIFIDNDSIILKKFHHTCIFCKNADDLTDFQGKKICPECLRILRSSDE